MTKKLAYSHGFRALSNRIKVSGIAGGYDGRGYMQISIYGITYGARRLS